MSSEYGNVKRESRLAVFEHVIEKKKPKRNKKFQPNKLSDDSSPSESELVIDEDEGDVMPSNINKVSSVRINASEEHLELVCEWNYCEEKFKCYKKFNEHLDDHASALFALDPKCLWRDCPTKNIMESVSMLIRHLSYHGYLTKLKCIGENVLKRNSLPECEILNKYEIDIPSEGYFCEWYQCSQHFNTIYQFLLHMKEHSQNNVSGKCAYSREMWIICEWSRCNMKFKTKYKLAEHLRVHTKEKLIACPTCNSIFSTKSRFCDHRNRQLKDNLRSYQCSQCLKLFPSEKLLSDHMRSHINQYKCTLCDMTCASPSILAKHCRFRHLNEKPFKCLQCKKKFVTKNILRTHLLIHNKDLALNCDICDFSCKSKVGLDNHYVREHKRKRAKYECHVCKQQFNRGDYLTKHLINLHKFHWPSGHSRFRYRKDQDGICRLQTVRYESLEVTEEMIRSETMQPTTNMPALTYNVTYDNNQQGYTLKVVENINENSDNFSKNVNSKESEKVVVENSNVIVTLDDVDMHGNLIKSRVIQDGNMIVDPATLPTIAALTSGDEAEQTSSSTDEKMSDITEDGRNVKYENVHYFSKEIIMNYDKFKIETPKSEC